MESLLDTICNDEDNITAFMEEFGDSEEDIEYFVLSIFENTSDDEFLDIWDEYMDHTIEEDLEDI